MRLIVVMFIGWILAVAAIGAAAAKGDSGRVVPMQVVVVELSDPACGTRCPRWISAEGEITPATPQLFRKVLKDTETTALPILIQSTGGAVSAALEIGRMLRKAGRDIAVAATRFETCRPGEAKCRPSAEGAYRGRPHSYEAFCASACAYLIAGAKRRFVPGVSFVGVHQVQVTETQIETRYEVEYDVVDGRKQEVGRRPVARSVVKRTESSPTPGSGPYRSIKAYLTEMGVTEGLLFLSYAAKHESVYWLSEAELRFTGLVTDTMPGESLLGLPVIGRDEYTLPAPSKGPAGTYEAWLERLKAGERRRRHAVLQVRMGEINGEPLMLVMDFEPGDAAPSVDWSAVMLIGGRLISGAQASVGLDADGVEIVGDRRLAGDGQREGLLPRTDFCRLASSANVRFRVKALRLPGQRDPVTFTVERPVVPWIDRDLIDRCDGAAKPV